MDRKVTGLTTQFTKLMAALKQNPSTLGNNSSAPRTPHNEQKQQTTSNTQPEAKHSYTDEGVPICSYCNNIGHVQRHCRIRRRAMQAGRKTQAQGGQ